MTSREFCYWLQGYFEIEAATVVSGGLIKSGDGMTDKQVKLVKAHLALVFKHEIDPSAGSAEHQAELNQIHDPATASLHRPPGVRC